MAKLINTNPDKNEKGIHSVCQFCERICTHPNDENANKEDGIWKKINELDANEKSAYNSTDSYVRSHGICDICWNILEEHDHDIDYEKLTQLSLNKQ